MYRKYNNGSDSLCLADGLDLLPRVHLNRKTRASFKILIMHFESFTAFNEHVQVNERYRLAVNLLLLSSSLIQTRVQSKC
jgi:hypothetical protein